MKLTNFRPVRSAHSLIFFICILKSLLRLAPRLEPSKTIRIPVIEPRTWEVGDWSEDKNRWDQIIGYRTEPNPQHQIWSAYETRRKELDKILDGQPQQQQPGQSANLRPSSPPPPTTLAVWPPVTYHSLSRIEHRRSSSGQTDAGTAFLNRGFQQELPSLTSEPPQTTAPPGAEVGA